MAFVLSNPSYDDRRPRRRGIKILPLIAFAAFGIFYYFSHGATVPITGRRQLVDLSLKDEVRLGIQAYQEVLSGADEVEQGDSAEAVRSIGRRIAAVADDPGFPWEFRLLRSEQANAFALPGGKVAVFTGILPIVQNADGLAVVMGHEISHAIARHGAERIAHQRLAQIGSLAVGAALQDMDYERQRMVMAALGVGAQFGVILPFSRQHESEADYMGLVLLARACFDPEAAPSVWERMSSQSGAGRQPEFLSTHPDPERRIQQFREWLPEARRIREESCASGDVARPEGRLAW